MRPLRLDPQEVAVMLSGTDANRNHPGKWRSTPWTTESAPWRDIDERLPPDHLARRIQAFVSSLDLEELRQSYLGVGKRALPVELMLMVALYEMQCGRLHPCDWAEDCKFSDPVKWLAMGLQPSASFFYTFRKRLGPWIKPWNQLVVRRGMAEGWTKGNEQSIDGTFVAALGSRHRLLKAKTLGQRIATLRQALTGDCRAARLATATTLPRNDSTLPVVAAQPAPGPQPQASVVVQAERAASTGAAATGLPPARPAYWMARTARGRGRQLHRYRQAQSRLDELLSQHAQCENRKAKRKRRRPDQVRICPNEPAAALGRDKLKTFRPLYNVQLATDLDTPLIIEYGLYASNTDAGLFIPTVEAVRSTTGQWPEKVLVDGIYATAANLAYSAAHGVTVYAPVDDKPALAHEGNGIKTAKPRLLGKEQFRWDAAEQTYYCPEGHRLIQIGCKAEKREQDQEVRVYQYRCPREHCQACPRAKQCTSAPQKGRTIKRSEHEDKVDALRQRMHTPEGQALYKKRSQTVEPRIGDLKAHRGLRCFAGFGQALALIQVGLLVLVHNGLWLLGAAAQRESPPPQAPYPDPDRTGQPLADAPPTTARANAPDSQRPHPEAPT